MRFVRKRGAGAGSMFVAAVGDGRIKGYAEGKFEEFCRKLGGRVERDLETTCRVDTDAVGTIKEHVNDFYGFIRDYAPGLDRPVALTFSNPLVGGWEEYVKLTFDPRKKEFGVYAKAFGRGLGAEEVWDVEDREISRVEKITSPPAKLRGEGYVDQNPATDEFVGVGTASASFPLEWIRSAHFAPELEQLVDRALKLAESLAEEAEEELISLPPEEEEEY